MKQPKCVGLDFDGVIVKGTNQKYFDAYHHALDVVGVSMPKEVINARIREGWGSGQKEQLTLILKEHPEHIAQAVNAWEECVLHPSFWADVELIEGVKDTIEWLAQRVPVVIVSGSGYGHIKEVLDTAGVTGVSQIFSSADVESHLRKPHPYMLEQALLNEGCAPEDAIYVGDMENDARMARAAGVTPVAVLTGGMQHSDAQAMEIPYILDSMTQVPEIFFGE